MARFRRRRMFRRSRHYGRRRRPSAARAVSRVTLAPRHQFLKLKCAMQVTNVDSTDIYMKLRFPLQHPAYLTQQNTSGIENSYGYQTTMAAGQYPFARGWDAYGHLFQQYCVHAVKIRARINIDALNGCHVSSMVHPGEMHDSSNWISGGEVGGLPLGSQTVINDQDTLTLKRYINLNKLFGESVKKHDRYIHDWDDALTIPPPGDYWRGFFQLTVTPFQTLFGVTPSNFYTMVSLTVTFYISAITVNTNVAPDTLFALKQISKPVTSATALGEQADAVPEQQRQFFSTGVAPTSTVLKRRA